MHDLVRRTLLPLIATLILPGISPVSAAPGMTPVDVQADSFGCIRDIQPGPFP